MQCIAWRLQLSVFLKWKSWRSPDFSVLASTLVLLSISAYLAIMQSTNLVRQTVVEPSRTLRATLFQFRGVILAQLIVNAVLNAPSYTTLSSVLWQWPTSERSLQLKNLLLVFILYGAFFFTLVLGSPSATCVPLPLDKVFTGFVPFSCILYSTSRY